MINEQIKKQFEKNLMINGQMAILYGSDDSDFNLLGYVNKISKDNNPLSRNGFEKLIHPQDLVERNSFLHSILDSTKENMSDSEYEISYRIRDVEGNYTDVKEIGELSWGDDSDSWSFNGIINFDNNKRDTDFEHVALISDFGFKGRDIIRREIDKVIDKAKGNFKKGFVLSIGLDRISYINDTFGSDCADEVINKSGRRLQQIVGDTGIVKRICGDVFGILFPNSSHEEMPAVAKHIINSFYNAPIITDKAQVRAGVSIGGRTIDDYKKDGLCFLGNSERAMAVAKKRGRGCFVQYSEDMLVDNKQPNILEIGDRFLRALHDGRVKLAFQPIMNSGTNDVSFHECLMRLVDEEGKVHVAGKFIPAIEQLGMARLVDQYCMNQAIAELMMFPELRLSVNVTNWTLTDGDWLKGVVQSLRDRPSVAERMIVEITESVAMDDIQHSIRVIRTLQNLGCRVALDDFGAGQTAFSQLNNLDVDIVKIDKSFVRNMKENENHLFIKTLQTLAHGIKLETVAEGAETLDEADILVNDGVNYIQGFAYGFPSLERIWLPKNHIYREGSIMGAVGEEGKIAIS